MGYPNNTLNLIYLIMYVSGFMSPTVTLRHTGLRVCDNNNQGTQGLKDVRSLSTTTKRGRNPLRMFTYLYRNQTDSRKLPGLEGGYGTLNLPLHYVLVSWGSHLGSTRMELEVPRTDSPQLP